MYNIELLSTLDATLIADIDVIGAIKGLNFSQLLKKLGNLQAVFLILGFTFALGTLIFQLFIQRQRDEGMNMGALWSAIGGIVIVVIFVAFWTATIGDNSVIEADFDFEDGGAAAP